MTEANRPFLLRLAVRQHASPGEPTMYDNDRDELLMKVDGNWIPAVDSPKGSPDTKKADVETGEDSKDRW